MPLLSDLSALLADRFRLERELGRGGMGIVFLAEDLKHRRAVALKVLRPELAQSLGKERFLREILISASLNHPNILPLIDSGEAGGYLYYVMPYVEGESLRHRLAREKQLPIGEAVQITREVAEALDYAHGLGVVHRDIKPENVLLAAGHPVITDFGIAQAVSEAGGIRLTETGLPIGTPVYMSPEQAAGQGPVDGRSDVYALACVLYELLAGEPPYTGATPQAVLARKLVGPVPDLRVVRDTVAPSVEDVILRGLSRIPADRFASAREFADALADPTPPSRWRSSRIAWRHWGLAAIPAMAAVLGAGWLVRNWRANDAPTSAPLNVSVRQLTAEPGVEWFPSISPDGRWLVYSGVGTGDRDIYLRSVGGEHTLNLTLDSPEDDDHPVFSPDGDQIAFWSARDGGGIFVMARTGEAVRRVTRGGYKPTWSPDGRQLGYVTENVEINPQNADARSELWIVDIASGRTRRLETVTDAVLPSWSPNGHRIAYFSRRLGESLTRWGLWTVDLTGGEPVPTTDRSALDWNPVWSPDGRHLYFASDRGGSMNLWRVGIDEMTGRPVGRPQPITTPATSLAHIAISSDGRRIVYSSILVTINVQKIVMDARTGTPIGEPAWLTTGTRRWSSPDPSPDGRIIAMYSLTQPDGDIFVINADGTGLRQVTGDSAIDRVPRWSPDGQWLAFFTTRGGRLQLWKIRPDGSDLMQLTDHGSVGVWSADGTRIATSGALDGPATVEPRKSVYVLDPARAWSGQTLDSLWRTDTTATRFSPNAWSPDGRRLAGSDGFGDTGVSVYTFATGRTEQLTDFGQWPVWLPDSRTILFVSGGNAFYTVNSVTREVRRVYAVERDVIGPLRLTADGRAAYFTRRVTEADVWLVTID